MSNFDLNVSNYKQTELEEIFELPKNYDLNIIEKKASLMIENINNDKTTKNDVKNKTVQFINSAKDILHKYLKKNPDIYNVDKTLQMSSTLDAGSTFLIERPTTPYSKSFPSEYYPGTINPLNKRVLTKYLNIDTRFRDNYYSTQPANFTFELPLKLSNIVSMKLSSIELPITSYIISKQLGNHFFWISINGSDISGEPVTETGCIIIPNGNYVPGDLISYINNFIHTNFTTTIYLQYVVFTLNINQYQSGSGQTLVGFSSIQPTTLTIELNFQKNLLGEVDIFTQLPLKLGWILGFRESTYVNNQNYVSEGIINLVSTNYYYLVIDDYNNNVNNNFYSAFNSSILNKNILARISNNIGFFNILSQTGPMINNTPRNYFGPVDIQKINVQLLDEYGRIVDLNFMDFSFCLSFDTIYDL